jgi:hypothetical protein
VEEVTEHTFNFAWDRVQSAEGVPYLFPEPVTAFIRARHAGPAIYRWLVQRDGCPAKVYFGEAEILWRRLDNYRRGSQAQPTAARIKEVLVAQQVGFEVVLEVLQFVPISINGAVIDNKSLGRKEVRCFLENLLILTLPPGIELLNKVTSVETKQVRKAVEMIQRLPPLEQQRFLSQLTQTAQKKEY